MIENDLPEAGDAPLHQETVLVVDDTKENLTVIGELLNPHYNVRIANSGQRALKVANSTPVPDLILLDIMMPEMDGYETLAELRANPATRHIPVIFVTALDADEDEERGLALGAVDYIAKPIRPAILLGRIRTQLDLKLAQDQLRRQNASLEAEVQRRVAENLAIQEQGQRNEARLNRMRQLILSSASEGIFGVDVEGRINFINPAATTLLGYTEEELLGQDSHRMLHHSHIDGSHYAVEDCPMHLCLHSGITIRDRESTLWHRDGTPLPLECSHTPIVEDGRIIGAVTTLRDIRDRKRYLEQLERHSNYDELTDLPNRNLLYDRLNHNIEVCRRSGMNIAVLTLNLDRFKSINDTLGRAAGDQVLREVAQRLGRQVRKMDTLARLEGDEFVLVVEVATAEQSSAFAQPILKALANPFHVAEREFFLSGSIGIATFPKDGDNGEELLRNADAAMYKAKTKGGNRFQFYTAEMNQRSLERLDLENGLRRAIDQGELVVYYQPQVNLRNGAIIGAEALVRWQDPEKGLVMPGSFIALAEETGLIVPLGEWVLRTACSQNKAWQDAGLPKIPVAVNLSARQFAAQDVVELAARILHDTGLAPNYLELELTESAVMADAEAFIRATEKLKGLSIALSIDDFGTGFSSLSYLKRFAIDRLKIDQTFVRDITHDPDSASIALAIISLAHSLKLLAIAEGVETEAQLNFLRARNCDEMQGYFFSPALPADEFEAMLRQGRKLEFQPESKVPGRTLLLVDDEPGILSALKRLFRREGYVILTANSGKEGLDILAGHDVGVIISDARMPEMDGAEFLGKVRAMYPDTMRIILSGYTDLKAVTSAVNRGELFKFLTKPWDDGELLETIRDAFRQYEMRKPPPADGAAPEH
jgi:diguanylate cyclase (GGDEF)-like protein/PAS domain S-box-containing protein